VDQDGSELSQVCDDHRLAQEMAGLYRTTQ